MPPAASAVSLGALKSVFILNPISGRPARRARRRQIVETFIARHRLDSSLILTTGRGHGTEIARDAVAAGARAVIAVGGDGTMNEVAAALVNKPALYGLVPSGSGNGLARDLGLPLEPERALEVLLDGMVREIDTGVVNGRPFFNVMGLGFDAEISDRFNRCHERGLLSYFRIGFGALFTYRKERLRIEAADGRTEEIESFVTAVANSTQYGNNARIAPRARLDDGRLDLVTVRTGNPMLAVPLGIRMFNGSIDRATAVRSIQAEGFSIRRAAAGPVHTDGEVHVEDATLQVRVLPRSLRVIVPRAGSNGTGAPGR